MHETSPDYELVANMANEVDSVISLSHNIGKRSYSRKSHEEPVE